MTAPSPTPASSNGTSAPPPKRTARACDECRRLKIRCERARGVDEDDDMSDSYRKCRGCNASGIAPVHKRGPPKGYLSALEQRLNDAEALLGALICSKDPRASTLITDLSKDSLAQSIIHRVSNSEFGPAGRAERKGGLRGKSNETPIFTIDSNGHLVFTTPSNTWQDYLDMRLNLEMKGRAQLYIQAQQQGRPPSLSRTATATTLASATVADISASQEQGLKDIQMRLYGTFPPSDSIPSALSLPFTFFTHPTLFSLPSCSPPLKSTLPPSPASTSSNPESNQNSSHDVSYHYTTEEINTWLTADDIALASTNGNGHTNPPSSTNGSETYHAFMSPGGGDYGGGGGGKDSQDAPYGALCDILGLDRKQWDL
ncbi:hypothetical protein M422DRAFT_42332 [Sphaerobolus stellatus SS14]|nr:hypothetical protein M422DRAFT_42332 [Sphaerobolus stellatus SS14]